MILDYQLLEKQLEEAQNEFNKLNADFNQNKLELHDLCTDRGLSLHYLFHFLFCFIF
jgi:hypothetical protein